MSNDNDIYHIELYKLKNNSDVNLMFLNKDKENKWDGGLLDILADQTIFINNKYTAIAIQDEKVIGYAEAMLVNNKRAHVSYIEVFDESRGKGLCKILLMYLLKRLKSCEIKEIEIINTSFINKGIPACICYFKSGGKNFNVKYINNNKVKNMTIGDCQKNIMPKTYLYINKNNL